MLIQHSMTRPKSVLLILWGFCFGIVGVGLWLSQGLLRAFAANPVFNTLILLTLSVGVVAAIRQVLRIDASVQWLHSQLLNKDRASSVPFLLVPLFPMLKDNNKEVACSTLSLKAMLDGVFVRLDDGREVTRYIMNVLILLGLLGTFWGLLQTVGGIGAVIGGLSLSEGDVSAVFDTFKVGLQRPLDGMGISFSASLFGLASSLIVGFMDLQAGRAQTLFCTELEEYFSFAGQGGALFEDLDGLSVPIGGGSLGGGYQDAVVQALTDQLAHLQRSLKQQAEVRKEEQGNARQLHDVLGALDTHIKSQADVMSRIATFHQEATPVMQKLGTLLQSSDVASVEEHLRGLNNRMSEISKQLASTSDLQTDELRRELRIIARLLAGASVNLDKHVDGDSDGVDGEEATV